MAESQMIAATEFVFEPWGPALRIVALIILFLIVILGLISLVVVASLPGIVAARRHHPQVNAVRVAGWVGLPTGVLWAIAIIWAFWYFDERESVSGTAGSDSTGHGLNQADGLRQQIDHLEGLVKQLEQSKGRS